MMCGTNSACRAVRRHYFALFLWLETGAIAVSAAVAVARLRQSGHRFSEGSSAITWTAVFLVLDVFLLLSVGALSVTQVQLSPSSMISDMSVLQRYLSPEP